MELRALRPSDDRSAFSSGDPDLDRFSLRFAGQNQFRHHIGTTYIAIEGDRIAGYVTVAPGHVEIDALPVARRRKLPRYPLPVLRLARLAVDGTAQGQGIGSALLRFVLRSAVRLADEFGCAGVVVDAKPSATGFYERLGFLPLEVLQGMSGERPAPVALFLPISEIEASEP